ncbi:MAG: hypothetical protein EOM40_00695 [Clostridia bacterium]|nr:hypothetical protein [Clostridia bacterium]NCC43602.1 hypothetical protein [Clostridia bacterium]
MVKKIWNKEVGKVIGILLVYFFAGAAAGVLFSNLAYPFSGNEGQMMGAYLAESIKKQQVSSGEYLRYIIWHRGIRFIFLLLSGLMSVGRIIAACSFLGVGFVTGAAFSISLLQYGFKGMWVLLGAGVLQNICFTVSMVLVAAKIYMGNGTLLKNTDKKLQEYMVTGIIAAIIYGIGILLEAYAAPVFLSWILSLC